MKKLIALLLALVMALSITVVGATAETYDPTPDTPFVVIDGKLDDTYYEDRVITDDWWYCFENKAAYDPVDYLFLNNTLRFTWDDDFVYFYYTCETMADMYVPAEGEKFVLNETPAEDISIYIDTAPSLEYSAKCQNAANTEPCKHFYCNCNDGAGKYYRLQARVNPAFNNWYNYYRSDEGMFLTYEQFVERRQGETGYEDLEAMYALENGACEAVCFIDYETNTYGCELKYPRGEGEETFLCNFVTNTQGYEWDDLGPEVPYQESACLNPWMVNSGDGMFVIYYSEHPDPIIPVDDPAVGEVVGLIMDLPLIKDVTAETQTAVDAIQTKYDALTDDQKAAISDDVMAKFDGVKDRLVKLELAAAIGDVNGDKKADAGDALDILKSVVGKITLTEDQKVLANVNADDKVDASDALDILKYVVGKISGFKAATDLLA